MLILKFLGNNYQWLVLVALALVSILVLIIFRCKDHKNKVYAEVVSVHKQSASINGKDFTDLRVQLSLQGKGRWNIIDARILDKKKNPHPIYDGMGLVKSKPLPINQELNARRSIGIPTLSPVRVIYKKESFPLYIKIRYTERGKSKTKLKSIRVLVRKDLLQSLQP
jgi:hypothetical protein